MNAHSFVSAEFGEKKPRRMPREPVCNLGDAGRG